MIISTISARLARPLLGLVAIALVAAGEPEVVRLRVPAGRLGAWIGPGAERRGLTAAEFDRLVAAARVRRGSEAAGPRGRLLAADHRARWVDGRLIGESRLTFESAGEGPEWVVLSPWLATVDPDEAVPPVVLGLDDGRTVVRVEGPGPVVVRIDWRADPKPGSAGRLFAIGLPDVAPSTLTIDLPDGLEPVGPPGLRLGPEPIDGAARWRFEGAAGTASLLLLGADGRDRPAPPVAWGRSATAVELDPTACSWRSEWQVDLAPGAPRLLRFELDPRLEFLEAVGEGVEAVEPRREGGRSTIAVRLARPDRPDRAQSIRLTLAAIAPPAAAARWVVPWSRLVDASWTGSTTRVVLAAGLAIESCRELDGRRVADREGPDADALGRAAIAFESRAPGPVAELTLRDSTAEVVAEVRGELVIGPGPARAVADLSWRSASGRPADLVFGLPEGWSVESIAAADGRELSSWRARPRAGGATRVEVRGAATAEDRGSIRVVARAEADGDDLAMPRLRPEGLPIADERWTATVAPGFVVAFEGLRGVAWLDPADEPAPTPVGDTEADADHEAPSRLAWRWVAANGAGRVRLARPAPAATIRVDQQFAIDDRGLRACYSVQLPAVIDRPVRLVMGLPSPVAAPPDWSDRSGGRPSFRLRLLDEDEAIGHGLDPEGVAWELAIEPGTEGPIDLLGTLAIVGEPATVPLLAVEGPGRVEGTAAIGAARPEAIRARPSGNLRALATGAYGSGGAAGGPWAGSIGDGRDEGADDRWVEPAFRYSGRPGRIELERRPLGPATAIGVIRRALLLADPGGPGSSRRSLRLEVVPTVARELLIVLPAAAEVADARVDGREARAWRRGRVVGVPLRGSAPTIVELDYDEPVGSASPPEWPRFSMPVASSSQGSPSSRSVRPGPVDADPFFAAAGRAVGDRPSLSSSPVAIVELDRATGAGATTLGELLAALDRIGRPVAIDGRALAALGLGPGAGIEGAGTVRDRLATLGLVVVPGPTTLIVTTTAARDREATGDLLAADRDAERALAWGHDGGDRLASLSTWIDSAPATVPARLALADDERRDPAIGRPWLLQSEPSGRWAVAVGLGVFCGSRAFRRVGGRWFAIGVFVAIVVAALAIGFGTTAAGRIAGGAAWGLVLAAALRFGQGLRDGRRLRSRAAIPPGDRSRSTSIRLAGTGSATALLLAAGLARLDAAIDGPGPIVAFFPFDGPAPAGPIGDDDPVVLRLDDYRRLVGPDAPIAADRPIRIGATRIVHRVDRTEGRATVASRYSLWLEGDRAAEWSVPATDGFDFVARLDGRDLPVRIAADGRRAIVEIDAAGAHELEIRRGVPLRVVDEEESIAVDLGRSCLAVVELAASNGRRAAAVPVDDSQFDGGMKVLAVDPPTDPLEVRWSADDRPADRAAGVAEGLVLWDSEPAGDRYRSRWTWRGGGDRPVVRMTVDRGLQLRSATAEGSVIATRMVGPVDRPISILAIDPPLAEGTPLELDLWAPRAMAEGTPADPVAAPPPIKARLPKVEPLDTARVAGVVALRRPGDWTGRIAAGGRLEPVTEEAFVAAWGAWPRDELTLAGVARFTSSPVVELASGPRPVRRVVRPTLRIDPAPGRLGWRLEADVQDRGAPTVEVAIGIDEGLEILGVAGDGLTAWSRPAPGTLSLRFDRQESLRRSIAVDGWIAAPTDPMLPRPPRIEHELKWPSWPGSEIEAPRLVVAGSAAGVPRLDGLAGLALPRLGLPEALAVPGLDRPWYEFAVPPPSGRLSWPSEPGRLTAAIHSRLTIGPATADWSALLRLEIVGGPCESVPLRLPAGWAEGLVAEVDGETCPIAIEASEAGTLVTLRPARLLWGSAVVRLTSERLRTKGDSIDFPALVPLGKGSFAARLEVVDATGRGIVTIESTDLDRVAVRPDDRGPDPLGPGRPSLAFVVRRPGWSLRLRVPPPASTTGEPEPPRGWSVELAAVIDGRGTTWGLADCRLSGDPATMLPFEVDRGVELVAASVDGEPVRPRSAGGSRWEVPLPAGPTRRVVVLWRAPGPAAGRSAGPVPLALPAIGPVPTTLVVWADDSTAIRADRGPLAAAGAAAIWSQRLEAIAAAVESGSATAVGASADRPTLASLERVVADARRVGRLIGEAGGSSRDRLGVALDRAGRIVGPPGEASTTEGLTGPPGPEPEPLDLPRVGRPHGFVGLAGGTGPRPDLSWRRAAVGGPDRLAVGRRWLGAALLLAPILLAMYGCRSRPIALALLTLGLALAARAIGLDPWLLAAAIGLGLWGRLARG